jgi:hypothetical protein
MAQINLSKDFKEFIGLLNKNKVEFIVVGGYAVGFHGYVRFTGDIDIWVNHTSQNAEKLLNALKEFGFGSLTDINLQDFNKPDSVVQLGHPPLRIDLMTSVSGLTFEACFEKKINTIIEDIDVPFLDLESLKKQAIHQ